MLNFCGIVVAILKMETGRNQFGTSQSTHIWNVVEIGQCWIAVLWKMATGRNFRCQESIQDIIIYPHMKWCWNRTMLNLCGIVVAILKMATGRIFQCLELVRDIIIYPHVKFWWYQTMLNFWGIVAAIFMPSFDSHFENGRHLENFENAELLL